MLPLNNPGSKLLRQLAAGILIGAALTLIVLWGFPSGQIVGSDPAPAGRDDPETQPAASLEGQPAPEFELADLHSRRYALQDFHGKVVLLNFWATWCAPCRLEMPLLEQRSQELSEENFEILLINLGESAAQVRAFVGEIGLTLPVLLDPDGAVSEQYRIIGYPSTVIIDATGKIEAIHIGIISNSQLNEYLRQVGLNI